MKKRAIIVMLLFCAAFCRAQNTSTFGTITRADATCTATSCVYYQVPEDIPWVSLTVSGTWVGTLRVQTISGPNATYQNINMQPWTLISTMTANGSTAIATGTARLILVQAPTWSSGSASIRLTASPSGSPLANPVFSGQVTSSGLTAPDGGTSANCWLTNGTSEPCGLPGVNSTDYDGYLDPQSILELGGTQTVVNGCQFFGDSNSVGVGQIDITYSWPYLISNAVGCPNAWNSFSPLVTTIATGIAGNTTGDMVDTAFSLPPGQDHGNTLNVAQMSTNNIKNETTTPTAVEQLSYKTQIAATASWEANSINNIYIAATQPTTGTSYFGGQGNIFTMNTPSLNGYQIGQRGTMTGCTTTEGLVFNSFGFLQITAATPTTYSFSIAGNGFVTFGSIGSPITDTCTFTPSTTWTINGTWDVVNMLTLVNVVNLGAAQGTLYQNGNQLTIPCSVRNEIVTVQNVTPDSLSGVTVNTTDDGAGHLTGATINSTGNPAFSWNNGQYITVVGGDGTAILQVTNVLNGHAIASVALVAGHGGNGYSATTGAATLNAGQLNAANGFVVNQLGSGCASVASVAPTCAVGSGSACGTLAALSNKIGTPFYETTTGGSMTLSNVLLGSRGDIDLWYPQGFFFPGSLTVTDNGVPLTDTWAASQTIQEANTGGFIPGNYPTGQAISEAHFRVATIPGQLHTIVVTCATGPNCGFGGIALPTYRTPGSDGPNLFLGGAISMGAAINPMCDPTGTVPCSTVFSGYVRDVVNAKVAEGERVKFTDLSAVDPYLSYFNTAPNNTLLQNCIGNSTNFLHLSSCGQQIIANQFTQTIKAINAQPLTYNFTPGLNVNARLVSGIYYSIFGTTNSLPLLNVPTSTITQAMVLGIPGPGFAIDFCTYTSVAKQNPNFTPNLYTCQLEWGSASGQPVLTLGPATALSNSPSSPLSLKANALNNGVTAVFTPGTGYGGIGTVVSTGGTCTTQPIIFATISGGGISARITNSGVCTVAPTGFIVAGFTIGSGFNAIFTLAGGTSNAEQFTTGTDYQSAPSQPTYDVKCPAVSFTGGVPMIFFQGTTAGGLKFLCDFPNNQSISISGINVIANTNWLLNNVSGTPMMGASTSALVSAKGLNTNASGQVTAIVSNANTSATGGAGTGTVTCLSAACTNLRGTYSVAGGTFVTGNALVLVWPTTTTAYVCTASQNGGATNFGIGNSVATATGMTITNAVTIAGVTATVNYSCTD